MARSRIDISRVDPIGIRVRDVVRALRTARPGTSLTHALCCLAIALAACASIEPPIAPLAAPGTPQRAVQDTYHGQTIVDPYRWLENVNDPEVRAWMRAQASYSRGILDRIAGRDALLQRMLEVENSAPARVSRVSMVANGNVFLLRRDAGTPQHKLVTRAGLEAPERVVVDPTQFGPKHAIDYFIPSPDGRFVAYGLSPA